mmetsp:Transcript_31570/g.73891  ORF Transcript_31570/g.73891 Transcript_31570/m.73891 type:complete len:221 (+) Transcript_31570:392-1054(+)
MAHRPRGLICALLRLHLDTRPPRHEARQAQEGGRALLHPIGVGVRDLGAHLPPRARHGGLCCRRSRLPPGTCGGGVADADGSGLCCCCPAPGRLDARVQGVGHRQALDPRHLPHPRGVWAFFGARRRLEGPRGSRVHELVRIRGGCCPCWNAFRVDVLRRGALLEQCAQLGQGQAARSARCSHCLVLRRGGALGARGCASQGPHPSLGWHLGAVGCLYGA